MKIRKILSVVLAAILLVLCTACSAGNSLSGKYYMSSSDSYCFDFKDDGTVKYTQGNYFFNGTYEYYDGKYEIYIQGEGPFLSTKFVGEKNGDILIISGGIFSETEFEKYSELTEQTVEEAPASDFEYEDNSELGGIVITKYIGSGEKIRIPSKIEGKKVVGIGSSKNEYDDVVGAFEYCKGLTSVTIPEGVEQIDESAFYSCSELQEINIDKKNSCFSSKDGVLYDKSMTRLITCPEGKTGSFDIPDSVYEIGSLAFRNCRLTTITIPNSVTKIGESAFSRSGLTTITIPNGVTEISDGMFYECNELTTIKIPDSVTKIGSSAFFNCRELHEITIPDGVTSISEFAFWCCDANVTYKGKTYSNTYYYGLYNAINGDPIYSLYNSYFR